MPRCCAFGRVLGALMVEEFGSVEQMSRQMYNKELLSCCSSFHESDWCYCVVLMVTINRADETISPFPQIRACHLIACNPNPHECVRPSLPPSLRTVNYSDSNPECSNGKSTSFLQQCPERGWSCPSGVNKNLYTVVPGSFICLLYLYCIGGRANPQ
jgi:hypothetical protein